MIIIMIIFNFIRMQCARRIIISAGGPSLGFSTQLERASGRYGNQLFITGHYSHHVPILTVFLHLKRDELS